MIITSKLGKWCSPIYIPGLKDRSYSKNYRRARLLFEMNPPQLPGPFQIEEIGVQRVQAVNFFYLNSLWTISEKPCVFLSFDDKP